MERSRLKESERYWIRNYFKATQSRYTKLWSNFTLTLQTHTGKNPAWAGRTLARFSSVQVRNVRLNAVRKRGREKERYMMKYAKKILVLMVALVFVVSFIPLSSAQEGGNVNINKASVEELTQLKGIGSAYAERIVKYRDKNGPFEKPEDIMKVKGIGQKTWDTNKDRITVK